MEAIRSLRLQAVRCIQCGETRWSLFTSADLSKPCQLCGGETRLERRVPGSGPRTLLRERRSARPLPH
jgi:hypothetical protein